MPDGDISVDHARTRDLLADAVREAGALALLTFRGEIKSWIKGKSSPVTEADVAVDELLRERLQGAGDFGWLSEETEDDPARLQKRHVWVVDPIDGTRAYLAGSPEWVISAALVSDSRPVVGALYAPVTDELFLAIAGAGVTLNGRSRRARAITSLVPGSAERSAASTSWRRSSPASKRWREFPRLRCGSPAWPPARSMPPSRPPTAMIGTLRRLTFWCTKPGAR